MMDAVLITSPPLPPLLVLMYSNASLVPMTTAVYSK